MHIYFWVKAYDKISITIQLDHFGVLVFEKMKVYYKLRAVADNLECCYLRDLCKFCSNRA